MLTLRGPSGVRRGPALLDLGIIQDGSILIEDGVIRAVGSTRRLENLKEARQALEIDVHGAVLMPGFVDAGLNVTLDKGNSSANNVKKTRQIYDESLELMRSCLQHGTLTAEIQASADAHEFSSDISVLRQLAKVGDSPVAMVRSWKVGRNPDSQQEVADFCETLDVIARRGLATYVEIAAYDKDPLSEELLGRIRTAQLPVKLSWRGTTPGYLEGALNRTRPVGVTCAVDISAAEAAALRAHDNVIMFSPVNDMRPFGPAMRNLIDDGLPIALKSGYHEKHAPCYSMQMVVGLAVMLGQLSIEEAISAATINAAHAVGQGNCVGTLEPGKRADVLVLSVADYRDLPRQLGINQVAMVLRDGNLVFNRSRWKIGSHEPLLAGGVRSERF